VPVTGIERPGDLEIDRSARQVFVSSQAEAKNKAARGAIHVVDIDDPLGANAWRDRTLGVPTLFRPQGVSLYESDGLRRLFVVNAAAGAVEIFDILPNGDLDHLETLGDLRLSSPNSVVATGPRSFYVSNDAAAPRGSLMSKAAFVLRIPDGKIFYFNGVAWQLAAEGLRFASGLEMSPDGSKLYAAEASGMALREYARMASTGGLVLYRTTQLDGAADNINVTPDGELILAVNPKPLQRFSWGRAGASHAPSTVMTIDLSVDDSAYVSPVPTAASNDLAAATVADRIDKTLVIGGPASDRYLICDLGA
jgi:arylesterase/paraoxonase